MCLSANNDALIHSLIRKAFQGYSTVPEGVILGHGLVGPFYPLKGVDKYLSPHLPRWDADILLEVK
jgi:hypothetical protein